MKQALHRLVFIAVLIGGWLTPVTLASERMAIVEAQRLFDMGEYEKAIGLLEASIQEYPQSDILLALYGDALYENKQILEAETAFRRALEINPLNSLAARRIEVIRAINDASVSKKTQQLEEITLDKVFDLFAMALAFTLGSMFSRYLRRLTDWNFSRRSKQLFLRNNYEDFVDMLEIQISTNELRPLRHSVNFMLRHKSEDEIIDMLNVYVNTEENLQTLTRMVRLSSVTKAD